MRSKLLLLILFCLSSTQLIYAQNRTISGTVTDGSSGNPISGVSVKVSESNRITQTDVSGKFSIEISSNTGTLVFSYIGYHTKQVPITNSNTYDVTLLPSEATIDEVVVVGYGTQLKKDVTGSTSTVKMSDLENVPLPTIESALQGRASGVFINSSSGKLGQALQIRVRGTSSITASSQPLFVIDGVPVITRDMGTYTEPENPLAAINPDDIESMDILKDASAAAIYGARGSNGVVLITTKKGKAGRTNIDVGYYYGGSKPTKVGKFLNSQQYRELLTASLTNAGYIGSAPDQYSSMSEFWEDWTGTNDWDENYDSDWANQAFRTGNVQQLSLTMSGGNDKTRFIASGAHNDNKGILVGNRYVRTSGRLGLDHNVSTWLTFGGNINLNKIDNYRVNSDNAFSNPQQLNALPPIQPIRNADGELNNNTVYYNNLIDLENGRQMSNTYRTFSNIYATAQITPNLVFRTEYGLDLLTLEEEMFLGSRTQDGGDVGGYGFSHIAKSINYNFNNTLTYSKLFNDIHDFSILLGMSYQDGQFRYTQAEGNSFPSDKFQKIASAAVKSDASSYEDQFSFLSYFGRINYKLKNRYLLEGSLRVDGSSRFGPERKYGTFPAASIGWVVSEEDFFGDGSTWNYLKARVSYGLTGNAEIGNYLWRTLYSGVNYAGTPGTKPTTLGDRELTWENTKATNIGLDLGFFNDRLTFTFDAYHKKTTDLLLNVPIVSTSGFTSILQNYGELENKGLEFSFNSRNLVNTIKWSTSFNIAFNKNKVLKLVDGQPIYPGGRYLGRVEEGKPFGYFYGKAYAGVDPNNGDALYYVDDTRTATTNDYNAAGDQELGTPHPKFYGGFGNRFSYKNFDLDIQTQFVYGNDIYNAAGAFQAANGDYFDNQLVSQMNYWKQPGDITDIPQPRFDEANGTRPSSRYLQDGSYFRVKNVVLGYNIPSAYISKYKINNARVYLSATNLFTITNYEGYDPEINTTFAGNYQLGTDFYTPPQARTITFGINVGF